MTAEERVADLERRVADLEANALVLQAAFDAGRAYKAGAVATVQHQAAVAAIRRSGGLGSWDPDVWNSRGVSTPGRRAVNSHLRVVR